MGSSLHHHLPFSLDRRHLSHLEQEIEMYHVGKIIRKKLASPTIMVLELNVPTLESFLPGQWVDFVVPPHTWIGGFSIASSPKDLPNLTLAIKKSSHAPATWVHEESQVDQEVQVQVGGTCVLSPITTTVPKFLASPPRIFCAGGIGISPVLSQYREFLSQRLSCSSSTGGVSPPAPGPAARFLYSVSKPSELVFADELSELARKGRLQNPADQMVFALTQTSTWDDVTPAAAEQYPGVELKTGRIMQTFLDAAPIDSIFYICGPPGMLDDAVAHLTNTKGIDPANIQYEKWW